jgi:hypothetical protein
MASDIARDFSFLSGEGKQEPSDRPFDDKAEIARLAALSPFDYDRQRDAIADELGIRTSTLDKAVKEARRGGDYGGQGQAIEFDEIEPWPYPVDGAELLNDMSKALRSCVYLQPWQAEIVVLWILCVGGHSPRWVHGTGSWLREVPSTPIPQAHHRAAVHVRHGYGSYAVSND